MARAATRPRLVASGAALALALALAPLPGSATEEGTRGSEEEPRPAAPDDWAFHLGIYGWLTDMTGTLTARGTTVDVEPQLWNDIVRNLDGALMGALEVSYRGRWLGNLDVFGAKLSPHIEHGPASVGFGPRTFTRDLAALDLSFPVETPYGSLEVPVRADPGVLRVDVPRVETTIGPFDIDVKSVMVFSRAMLGYRVLDTPALELLGHEESDDPRRLRIDLFGGIRYWYLKTEVDVESPPIRVPEFRVRSSVSGGSARIGGGEIPPQTVALPTVRLPDVEFGGARFGGTDLHQESSTWWIDPVVGVRLGVDLTDRVALVVAGNVGGFDIGSASKLSWETVVWLDWRFGETTSLALGYRALDVDRRKGKAQADVTLHGPLLGLVFRF
jgi:hypothetical protein